MTHCWLRLRRHDAVRTGVFKVAGGPFNRGWVYRCRRCGHRFTSTDKEN